MKIGMLSYPEVIQKLASNGLFFTTGPFIIHVTSAIESVAYGIYNLYSDHLLADNTEFADFHVTLERPRNLRYWYHPQVIFSFDGNKPFKPLPLDQAFPMFEWTYNWCIANHSNQYLILHAACIEKNGFAAILPGPPGSGKSTLCAALVNRGWRLLSDELTLIETSTGNLISLARPANLKNDSIDIIKNYAPDVVMGKTSHDTVKGSVAHMKASTDSVARIAETALPGWIIFPKYMSGEDASLKARSKACTFIYAAENSFNYSHLGAHGFRTLEHMMDSIDCYDFTYSQLDDAVNIFNKLAEEK